MAARWGLRPEPLYLGVAYVALGLGLFPLLVRETYGHVRHEAKLAGDLPSAVAPEVEGLAAKHPLERKLLRALARFPYGVLAALEPAGRTCSPTTSSRRPTLSTASTARSRS